MFKKPATPILGLAVLLLHFTATAQESSGADSAAGGGSTDPIARIRDEGMNHSEVMKTLSYLSDVIGGRLTGSPNMKRANEWTRDQLKSWGLVNEHLEAWGPFGRGWELKRFSAQLIEPQAIPLKAYPNAWTPGFDQPIEAKVVYLDGDLEKYRGNLKGAIVLASPIRQINTRTEPMTSRYNDQMMLNMVNATSGDFDVLSGRISGGRRGGAPAAPARRGGAGTNAAGTGARRGGAGGGGGGGAAFGAAGRLPFLAREGVALVVNPSSQGDSGTIFVASAQVPPPENAGSNAPAGGRGARGTPAYATNAPPMPAQITVAAEDYNRLVRIAQTGQSMKMAVELQVKYHYEDPMAYNTVAEIPGTDLKNELVMLGGHMDSWHSGTGATDNGAGVAAAMEAVRIIKALDLKPRRTIRIALWSGEEQGLMGSRAYVSEHFGYFTNGVPDNGGGSARSPRDTTAGAGNGNGRGGRGRGGADATRTLVKSEEYEKLSAYFNLDNGGGKIRGIFMQSNEAVRPIFRKWLDPFRDTGADTVAFIGTGGTDHLSFDNIGLPGFQFIQDPMDYATRTHHSNEDVFDRIQADDMKQAATIFAAFVYQAAMRDEKLPRKADQ